MKRKKIFFQIMVMSLLMVSCGSPSAQNKPVPKEIKGTYYSARNGSYYQEIKDVNLAKFNNKTVESMRYCDGCGESGDYLIITFTDTSELKVYAYKYNMKVYY